MHNNRQLLFSELRQRWYETASLQVILTGTRGCSAGCIVAQ
jgi:hypothetical protein